MILGAAVLAGWFSWDWYVPSRVFVPRAHAQELLGPGPIDLFLDHVNVAVKDLAAARRAYEDLGFVIKPGRPHANSIENLHMKFADGTELELITSKQGKDELAREYLRLIEAGDGGAFVALRTGDFDRLQRDLRARRYAPNPSSTTGYRVLTFPRGHELRPLWFIGLDEPAIEQDDRYLAHPNSAVALSAVWLRSDLAQPIGELTEVYKYPLRDRISRLQHEGTTPLRGTEAIPLHRGVLIFSTKKPPAWNRSIVGATVEVESIEWVERVLEITRIPAEKTVDEVGTSYTVGPKMAHGIWLEFLQTNATLEYPHVEFWREDGRLSLPKPMREALEDFDSKFEVRRMVDYPPVEVERYPLAPKQAPFAVIGDFNGDGIFDAVLDGDSKDTGRRLAILSAGPGKDGSRAPSTARYRVMEIEPIPKIEGGVKKWRRPQRTARKMTDGVREGLRWRAPGKYESPGEGRPLVLENEAFEVFLYQKSAAIYYYEGGTFKKYVTVP